VSTIKRVDTNQRAKSDYVSSMGECGERKF